MVNILPESPSFGALLARGLGVGLGQGISQAASLAQQMGLEKNKMAARQNFIQSVKENQQKTNTDSLKEQFLSSLPEIEKLAGRDLLPEELDQIWQKLVTNQQNAPQQQDDFDIAEKFAIGNEPELSRLYTERGKTTRKEEFAREQAGEKQVESIMKRRDSAEMSDLRQQKLQQLFSEKNEGQFPPPLLAALFTKEGELNEIALSQLSPDAQEAMKLLADEVQGVKDTFGSQITGFEVRRFMARLPSLLNTPEGKRRVIRDLRMMNKINRAHDEGVLDIIDRYGGPGKISVSKANSIYRKENAKEIAEMKKQFLNANKTSFSDIPDPSMYEGEVLVDEDTGQEFISNGQEWVGQ